MELTESKAVKQYFAKLAEENQKDIEEDDFS
jgi:hypothetical protein